MSMLEVRKKNVPKLKPKRVKGLKYEVSAYEKMIPLSCILSFKSDNKKTKIIIKIVQKDTKKR